MPAEGGWDVDLLDPADPDDRAILIRLAHPGLDAAIEVGRETVVVGGDEVNPQLHLTIHEVVATQVLDDDPPEVFATAQRLLAEGHDRHEVLHTLGFVISGQIWGALDQGREYDRAAHLAALEALPGSFHAECALRPNRAERRARARRRGGRRP